MSTYTDVSVNVTSGSGTDNSGGGGTTIYTVPAGRYATVTLAVQPNDAQDTYSFDSGTTNLQAGSSTEGKVFSFQMTSSQSIVITANTGTMRANFASIEFSNP